MPAEFVLRILKAGGTSVDAGMLQQVQELCVGVTIKIKHATKQLMTRVLPTNDSGAHALSGCTTFLRPVLEAPGAATVLSTQAM